MADHAVSGRVPCHHNERQQVNDAVTADNVTTWNYSKEIFNSEISQDMTIAVKHEELDHKLPFEHEVNDYTVVKSEPADVDDVYSSEFAGSVGPADVEGALDAATTVKQEMDIGPTELQPPDIQYMLRPCKPEQGEDTLQGCYNMADHAVGRRISSTEHQPVTRDDSKEVFNSEISRDMTIAVKHEELDHKLPFEHEVDDYTVVKSEPADVDDVYSSEFAGSVGPADVEGALDAATTVKQEMDIGLTELQPPDIQYMLRPCKPEQGEHILQGCHETEDKSSSDKQLHMDTNQASTSKSHLKSQSTQSRSVNSIKGTGNLKAHMLTQTGERPYKCNACFKSFNTPGLLKGHMLTHSGERPHKCNVCFKSLKSTAGLKSHMLTHTGDRPYCDVCHKTFKAKETLKYHLLMFCVKSVQTKNLSNKPHMKSQSTRIVLQNKLSRSVNSIKGTGNLKAHMLTQTGERPYKCNACFKSFNTPGLLKGHMLTHSGERPHKCNVCFKSLKSTAGLKNHMLTHTGDRPYCDVCHKTFKAKETLKYHLLMFCVKSVQTKNLSK